MEYQKNYTTQEERNLLCAEANEDGFRMLHDDFNPDWFESYVIKHEVDPETGEVEPDTVVSCHTHFGTLTFTDQAAAQSLSITQRDIPAELDEIKTRLSLLENEQ